MNKEPDKEKKITIKLFSVDVLGEVVNKLTVQIFLVAIGYAIILVGSAVYGIAILRELKYPLLFMLTIALVVYAFLEYTKISKKPANGIEPDIDKIKIVDPKEDEGLWDGFEGRYYAFNAPFELEANYTKQKKRATYEIHRKRYKDEKFEAIYLYFAGENKEEKEKLRRWITNFKKFFDEIETARLGDNLKLYIVEYEKIPDYTFFVGKKDGKDCSVLYPFRQKFGSPKDVFLVHDKIFAKALKSMFDENLEKAKGQKGEIKTWDGLESLLILR